MDADEALARQLQAEEDVALTAIQRQAAAAHLRGAHTATTTQFSRQVEDTVRKVLSYEDDMALAVALSVIPLTQLEAAAAEACAVSAAMGEDPLDAQDALAHEMLVWFKRDFFRWVNNPPCDACGSGNTQAVGVTAPTPEEAAHRAGRTEVYRCTQCGASTRFARYNDPLKLLDSRRGRCGEWANCFTLCCRAVGLDARLAMDWEDHIWTEYWSPGQRRWVHLDPCEAAYDKPLLYEVGWGKQLSYVLAVGRQGVADVTRRYTRRYDELAQRRRLVSEDWLRGFTRHVTDRLRASLPPEQRQELERRDELEAWQLLSSSKQQLSEEELALPGRQTGDAAWLAARGEDGSSVQRGAGSGLPAPPPPGTRYRLAKDEGLAAVQPQRLCGGAVRASGENGPSETATCAFDGSPRSKWLDFGGTRPNGAWLEYRLPAEAPAAVLASYSLTSANDSPERDPRHVALEAWNEERGGWVVIDERRDLSFPQRHHRLLLHVAASPPASRRFRLRVVGVANPAAANSVQLACLDLYQQDEPAQQGQPGKQQQAAEEVQQQPAHPEAAPPQPGALAPPSSAQPADGQADNPWAALFLGGQPS